MAVALYLTLPNELVLGAPFVRYVVPALELAVLIPLAVTAPHRHVNESGRRRKAAMTLTAMISIANALSLFFLVHQLLYGSGVQGRALLYAAFAIWATNVIVFALWYWELDGGGPPRRLADPEAPRDFAFVQMTDPEVAKAGLAPALRGLPLRLVHELERIQPHRHDAADPLGEAPDAAAVRGLDPDAAARRRSRRQHSALTSQEPCDARRAFRQRKGGQTECARVSSR